MANLYAFNALTGAVLQSHPTGNFVSSSPAVINGVVYVGSEDDDLYALDARTGITALDCFGRSPHSYFLTGYCQWSRLRWLRNWPTLRLQRQDRRHLMDYSYWRLHSLVFGGCQWHALYRAQQTTRSLPLTPETGKRVWAVSTGAVIDSSPTVANGIVYVGSQDHKLYALDARTGATLWTYTAGDIIDPWPTVANGVVDVGSWDGKLYAFHLRT